MDAVIRHQQEQTDGMVLTLQVEVHLTLHSSDVQAGDNIHINEAVKPAARRDGVFTFLVLALNEFSNISGIAKPSLLTFLYMKHK